MYHKKEQYAIKGSLRYVERNMTILSMWENRKSSTVIETLSTSDVSTCPQRVIPVSMRVLQNKIMPINTDIPVVIGLYFIYI
ncbi:hypothetical protein RI065_10460 [Mycoplasmatota bacterium zrk1]